MRCAIYLTEMRRVHRERYLYLAIIITIRHAACMHTAIRTTHQAISSFVFQFILSFFSHLRQFLYFVINFFSPMYLSIVMHKCCNCRTFLEFNIIDTVIADNSQWSFASLKLYFCNLKYNFHKTGISFCSVDLHNLCILHNLCMMLSNSKYFLIIIIRIRNIHSVSIFLHW